MTLYHKLENELYIFGEHDITRKVISNIKKTNKKITTMKKRDPSNHPVLFAPAKMYTMNSRRPRTYLLDILNK